MSVVDSHSTRIGCGIRDTSVTSGVLVSYRERDCAVSVPIGY